MTEPAPTYAAVEEVEIDEAALAIAAEMVGVYADTVRRWIRDALNGTIPIHAGTMQHSAWLAYRTAVKAFETSCRPQERAVTDTQKS